MKSLHKCIKSTYQDAKIEKCIYIDWSEMFKRNVFTTKWHAYKDNKHGYGYTRSEAMQQLNRKLKSK